MGVEKKHLEKSLKAAVKFGEMVLVARNRYLPRPYMVRQACAAEELANCSDEGAFSVTEYCKHTQIGRNFAIDLLEYFDRLGLTERQGNSRRMKRSVSVVFSNDVENPRGRGSHPGGAPGLQIR